MQRAMDETDRRRDVQIQYNKDHGITPKGIQKAVNDVMEAGGSSQDKRRGRRGSQKNELPAVEAMSANDAAKRMKKLEKEMYECARNLEFERAAQLRDELDQIRASVFKQGAEAPMAAPSKKQGKTVS
jgi:excinuclease ABC subunit B